VGAIETEREEGPMAKAKRRSATKKKVRDLKARPVRGATAAQVKGGALKSGYNVTNFTSGPGS
jgi:hypothetical protein